MSSNGFNQQLLNPEVQDFIKSKEKADILAVSLGKSPFGGVAPHELATQVKGRQTALSKFPTWARTPGIYYPPTLNLEQASSEKLGRYKAGLVGGGVLVDLTGGFGVDSFCFSQRAQKVHYCERDASLAAIAAHNFGQLGAAGIEVHPGDGLEALKSIASGEASIDWIYLDPSRRREGGGRVFRLQDYQPPVASLLPGLYKYSRDILLKTAPMLDLKEGGKQLGPVREVHVLGYQNEVKELLWWLQEDWEGPADLIAADLSTSLPPLRFSEGAESLASPLWSEPLSYLYEPNACLLKAGAFKSVAVHYGLYKLHPHTHLYTSGSLLPFPGRRFEIREVLPYKPGKLPFRKANVSARNFPEPVARIRKRNRIADGGDTYLFFVRCLDESLRVLVGAPV